MNSISSKPRLNVPISKALELFVQLVSLEAFQWQSKGRLRFYERIWSPLITLWYLIWQRLQHDGVLQAVVNNAREGGANALRKTGGKLLSARIQSRATVAYSNARQRLPLAWMRRAFTSLGQLLRQPVARLQCHGFHVVLLDGTTVQLRPQGNIPKRLAACGNQHGQPYWCLMRVVVGFCAHSALACVSAVGSVGVSEQTMAVRLILQTVGNTLFVGDRNFGIWRVARAAVQVRAAVLVRLTEARAGRLLGRNPRIPCDQPVCWSPTSHDQGDPGVERLAVQGRLVATLLQRRGFRDQWLFLFTTLLDPSEFPVSQLVALYGVRWQVELDLRHLKEQMRMNFLDVKSARMAFKEWYAGLMAYNLIRGVMLWAASNKGISPLSLSFADARRLVASALKDWFFGSVTLGHRVRLETLLDNVAACQFPKRRKKRPSEPRAKRHVPEAFPPLRGSRVLARRTLQEALLKN